jgi:histidinol dehydrogenase
MKIIEGFNQTKVALTRHLLKDATGVYAQEQTVRQIVKDVRESGDTAVRHYTEKFDGVKLTSLEVDKAHIDRALIDIDKGLLAALKIAAERIAAFHTEQKKALLRDSKSKKLGWQVRPLERVGILAPGFMAPLPSSLLMTAIPAKVAGVKETILVTPPGKQGSVSPVTLAAAAIAGIDRVFSIGGAQAVAALAYGTESVPRVDKVCGPGAIYGQLAKKMVFGDVGIDGLYGPSEVIIIVDDTANPAYCAADLLAQAEHGSGASAKMITTSRKLAEEVKNEIDKQLPALSRHAIIAESLEKNGFIAIVDSVDIALELANEYAPEHLCLVVADAASYIDKVKNTGCLFLGENSIEALVDYTAGPSHVLPTEGTARFGSGLNILDFVKLINVINMDTKDIRQLGGATSTIARAEGLDAHTRAVAKRLEDMGKGGK